MNGYQIVNEALKIQFDLDNKWNFLTQIDESINLLGTTITAKFLSDSVDAIMPNTKVKIYYYKDLNNEWISQANAINKTLEINEHQVKNMKHMNRYMMFTILCHECGHFKIPIIKNQYALTELNTQLWAIGRLIELKVPKELVNYLVNELKNGWKKPPFPFKYRLASLISDKLKISDKISKKYPYWKVIKNSNGKYQLKKSISNAISYNWYYDGIKNW